MLTRCARYGVVLTWHSVCTQAVYGVDRTWYLSAVDTKNVSESLEWVRVLQMAIERRWPDKRTSSEQMHLSRATPQEPGEASACPSDGTSTGTTGAVLVRFVYQCYCKDMCLTDAGVFGWT